MRTVKGTLRLLPLLAAVLAAAPAAAAPTVDELLERIEQLERQQQAEEEALHNDRLREQDPELITRLKDVEFRTLSLQKQARMVEALDGVTAGVGLVAVVQRANDDATTDGNGESQLNYRGDVSVTLPGGEYGRAHGRLFAHVRIGQGDGLARLNDSFSAPNATAFADANGAGSPVLAQLWYQMDVPLGDDGTGRWPKQHMEITIGKMDPFLFFDQNSIADDESARFMNGAFVHNPLLDIGGDVAVDDYGFTPGLRLAYHNEQGAPESWRVSVGVFGAGDGAAFNDSFDSPFVIVQAETTRKLFGGLDGNYRLYGWSNGQASTFNDGLVAERHSGWGFSADQRFGDYTTVFGRYGASTAGKVKFDRALTLGAEFGGSYWGRGGDAVGVALGWLQPSDEYETVTGFDQAEEVVELFYRWRLNEQVALTPDVQWVRNAAGDGDARDMTVVGVRAAVNF